MTSKSLSFTEMQLALLSNAMIFAALSVQKLTSCSAAQYVQALYTAWTGVDSFPESEFRKLIEMLQDATRDMGLSGGESFRQVKLTDNIPEANDMGGYVPGTGPFNAKPSYHIPATIYDHLHISDNATKTVKFYMLDGSIVSAVVSNGRSSENIIWDDVDDWEVVS